MIINTKLYKKLKNIEKTRIYLGTPNWGVQGSKGMFMAGLFTETQRNTKIRLWSSIILFLVWSLYVLFIGYAIYVLLNDNSIKIEYRLTLIGIFSGFLFFSMNTGFKEVENFQKYKEDINENENKIKNIKIKLKND
jgi:hypothetical protein